MASSGNNANPPKPGVPAGVFRDFISTEPGAKFPPEKGRYCLYASPSCPFAHRATIVRALKGLDSFIDLYWTSAWLSEDGWFFSGERGSPPAEPLYGFSLLRQLYQKAAPGFDGRITVPVLWDKKTETIVSDESADILRMLGSAFDGLLPEDLREHNRPGGGLYPEPLRKQIDEMNEWVARDINTGVYKAGFAQTQEAYDANVPIVFQGLDKLEEHLSTATRDKPYLFGEYITETDVRLYTSLVRFDTAYHTVFMCNLKSIRHDYPRLHLWMRRLYWDQSPATRGAFYSTTQPHMDLYAPAYAVGRRLKVTKGGPLISPKGPAVLIEELRDNEKVGAK